MLARRNRLRRSGDFSQAMRRGAGSGRGASRSVVVHLRVRPDGSGVSGVGATDVPSVCAGPRVGFAVSKAVGGAVTRNLVRRRLRDLSRARLEAWPSCADVVVRALPASATASFAELARDLDRAWGSAYRQVSR